MARRRYRRRYNPVGDYANPRRRRYRRRHNPFGISTRSPFGINVEESAGAIGGAIGTSLLDSAVVGPYLGGLFRTFGRWQPAAQAVAAAVGAHWVANRFMGRWARLLSPGANVYAIVGVANTAFPGLVPITIGVPKQLAGLHLFAALQPPASAAMPAPAGAGGGAAALPAAAGGVTTTSSTLGRRIQAPNGL